MFVAPLALKSNHALCITVFQASRRIIFRHSNLNPNSFFLVPTMEPPPVFVPPMEANGRHQRERPRSSVIESHRQSRQSESSSESDSPSSQAARDKKKSSGLMGLFRRKKATQL